jgi:hypothetical protein
MKKTVKRRKAEIPIATPTPFGSWLVFGKEAIAPAGLYFVRTRLDRLIMLYLE